MLLLVYAVIIWINSDDKQSLTTSVWSFTQVLANRRRILFQLTESYQQFSSSVDEDEYSLHNREFKQHDSSLAIATRIVSVVNNASVDLSTPTIDQSKLLLCVAVMHFFFFSQQQQQKNHFNHYSIEMWTSLGHDPKTSRFLVELYTNWAMQFLYIWCLIKCYMASY